jgi:hypothetical protein
LGHVPVGRVLDLFALYRVQIDPGLALLPHHLLLLSFLILGHYIFRLKGLFEGSSVVFLLKIHDFPLLLVCPMRCFKLIRH